MKVDVESHCKICERCIKRKPSHKKLHHCHICTAQVSLILYVLIFLSIKPGSRNVCNVLVVTDHFTHYAQAFPMRDQIAITVAKTLWERYIQIRGGILRVSW